MLTTDVNQVRKFSTIFNFTQSCQNAEQFAKASNLLAESIEDILTYSDWRQVENLLNLFPASQLNSDTHLYYVHGWIYARSDRLVEAISLLERAKHSYKTTYQDFDRVARCCLELTRVWQLREHFRTADSYLKEEVLPLFEQNLVSDPRLQARFWLRMAELSPDINQLATGFEYATRSLDIYRKLGDLDGEFKALTRLASSSHEIGELGDADSKLELANNCLLTGNLGERAQARLLNLAVHSAWYRGNLSKAIELAYQMQAFVDDHSLNNQRIYARMLLGNALRAQGQIAEAIKSYEAARVIVENIDYTDYHPWIDTQLAWCHVLTGDLAKAREFAHASLKTSDLGQAMSFQVVIAVIEMLENQIETAHRLLTESLNFYVNSCEELAVCSLHFHLAWVALQQKQELVMKEHLGEALQWLERKRLDYTPYWWHPTLMSEACGAALVHHIHPDLVQRIFVNHLKQAGMGVLRHIHLAKDIQVRQRAYVIWNAVNSNNYDELYQYPDSPSKQVLTELIQNKQLRIEHFPRLQHELNVSSFREIPSATLLAVFGLYVIFGFTREEIAEKLNCSEPYVRNCITTIYQQFPVEGSGRRRWQQLQKFVREQGFIA